MADRTVSVKLVLDAAGYKRDAEAAAVATDHLDDRIQATDRDLKKLPRDGAEAAAAMKLLGVEAGKTKVALDDGLGKGSTSLGVLDQKLVAARVEVRKLADEFNRTGDAGALDNLFKADKAVKELEKFRNVLAGALGDLVPGSGDAGAKSGKTFGDKFVDTFAKGSTSMLSGLSKLPWAGAIFKPISAALSSMPPEAQAAIGAAIVAAIAASAAFIGAAFSGALLGAAGLGGIGIAIVGQLHSPAVMGAFSQLKDQFMATLATGTSAFAPLLAAGANTISAALLRAGPGLAKAMAELAPTVAVLSRGLGEFVVRLMPALQAAFHAAAPVLNQFSQDLPGIADAIRGFFVALNWGSEGARQGLHDLVSFLNAMVIATGVLLGGLSKVYEVLGSLPKLFTGNGEDFLRAILGIPPGANKAADATNNLAQANKDLAQRMSDATHASDDLSAALDKLIGKNMTADEAAIAQKQSVQDLTDSIAKNGRQWDINTQAGRDNTTALEAAIRKAEEKRVADVANGKDAVQAAQDYNQQVDSLLGIAGKAGDAKTALDALKGKYEIDVQETYTTHFVNEGTSPDQFRHGLAKGGIRAAQVGMIIPPSDPGTVLAGEPQTGGEVLTPLRGISQARAMALSRVVGNNYGFDVVPRQPDRWMGARRGGGGGSGTLRVELAFTGGNDALSSLLAKMQRTGDLQLTATRV